MLSLWNFNIMSWQHYIAIIHTLILDERWLQFFLKIKNEFVPKRCMVVISCAKIQDVALCNHINLCNVLSIQLSFLSLFQTIWLEGKLDYI
jgi:hypothetical protein